MSRRQTGDWDCPKCNGFVFASKTRCKCGYSQRDWTCPRCGDHVFESKSTCRCGQPKNSQILDSPKPGYVPRIGDWKCSKCGDNVWASRDTCRCGNPKVSAKVAELISTNNSVAASSSAASSAAASSATSTSSVAASSAADQDDSNLCCICLENQKNIMVRPCNHIQLCEKCVIALVDKKCPFCRCRFTSFEKVYL